MKALEMVKEEREVDGLKANSSGKERWVSDKCNQILSTYVWLVV